MSSPLYEIEGFEIGYASGLQNLLTQNVHFSGYTAMQFYETQSTWSYASILFYTEPSTCLSRRSANSAIRWKRCRIRTHPDTSSTRCVLFHSLEWLHSLWFNGHFVGCNSILFHPVVPTGKITCSGLIHKTHRTTLESLLQFELSNHNGTMRLPFFPCCVYACVSVYVSDS